MVNDRLGALKAVVNENSDNHDIAVTMGGGGEDEFLSDFFSLVEELSSSLDKIIATIDEIKKKHSAILSAPSTDERIKQELENLMAEVKKLSSKVKHKLKLMAEDIEMHEQNKISLAVLRIKKMQHSALSRRFINAMSDYNNIQTEYRQRCKDRIKRQLEITGNMKTDTEIEEMLEGGNFAVFTQGIVVETQKARQTVADIEDRHADIIKLEKSIRELHDMFVDMAVLVESQGDLVDRIEYNVQNAKEFVDIAKTDITRAVRYQSKARKKKMLLFTCVLVFIFVIIICTIASYFGATYFYAVEEQVFGSVQISEDITFLFIAAKLPEEKLSLIYPNQYI